MQDLEYQCYLKKQSYADLLSMRSSLDKQAYPERHALLVAELLQREKLPPPLPGEEVGTTSLRVLRPREVSVTTKLMLGIGFLSQFGSYFMQYADAPGMQAARPFVALIGAAVFLAGCVCVARTKGRSGWFGLLGIFSILGLGALCALEDKPRLQPDARSKAI